MKTIAPDGQFKQMFEELKDDPEYLAELKKIEEDEKECRYEKFIVLYNKPGNPPNAIPWTGLEPTLEFIKEKLEDGYTVKVKPYTREEWKER